MNEVSWDAELPKFLQENTSIDVLTLINLYFLCVFSMLLMGEKNYNFFLWGENWPNMYTYL